MLGQKIPLQLLTNGKILFDVFSKGSQTSEKRMMLEILAAEEGFRSGFISDAGFVRSSHNVADGLTKANASRSLQRALRTRLLEVKPEHWIVRREML